MPQDLLQIALEHHRAGRLRQAEADYRAALANEPDHPHASHWLGVLLFQAGQVQAAIPLLEMAAEKCPRDSAYSHNLARRAYRAGRKDEAIVSLERAALADPNGREPLVALAQARLSRGKPGDADAAVGALQHAQALTPDSTDLDGRLGIALLAGRTLRLRPSTVCRSALLKNPNDAMLFYHLALACRGAGETKEIRKALIKRMELDSRWAYGRGVRAGNVGCRGRQSSVPLPGRRFLAGDCRQSKLPGCV